MHSSLTRIVHPRTMGTMRQGFTLIELLLVIGVIGVLASIVIIAINPFEQLGNARDAERLRVMRETEKAQYQYLIDEAEFAANTTIPEGETNAIPICRYGKTNAGCVNIDDIVPEYVSCIAYDGKETNPDFTGYSIYQKVGRVRVQSNYLEQGPAESGCENAETIAMAGSVSSAAAQSSVPPPASGVSQSSAAVQPSSAATSSAGGTVIGIRRRPAKVAVR